MVALYGMNDKLGQATYAETQDQYLQAGLVRRPEISEETARLIDEEVRRILADRMASTRETLQAYESLLHRVAKKLLEVETLEGEAFSSLLGNIGSGKAARQSRQGGEERDHDG